MKYLITLIALTLALSALSAAQTTSDTTRRAVKAGRQPMFLDANGDGVSDRVQKRMQGPGRGIDRFIDMDGDGICDGRENGLGFQRSGPGGGKKAARKGQGRGK